MAFTRKILMQKSVDPFAQHEPMSLFLNHVRTIPYYLKCTHATLLTFRSLTARSAHTISGVQLRPYQEDCIETCIGALEEGKSTRLGVSLPTGSGKTTIFVALISKIKPPKINPRANKSLIVVNSEDIARQSAQRMKQLFPDLSVEIEQGAKNKATGFADVTVATYQSLNSSNRLAKFDPTKFKCVVVDEAHHSAAKGYLKVLAHFDKDIKHPDPDFRPPAVPHPIPIVGFSATLSRNDGLSLGSVFQEIVYHRDIRDMIRENWLSPVVFTTVRASLNLDSLTIGKETNDFNVSKLAKVINTDTFNNLVVKSWIEKASNRRSTLVFCVDTLHLQALTDTFRRAGVDARYLYAKTPDKERRQLIEDFKAGVYPVLCNVGVLTEGADIPNIDCVIIARPTQSLNLYAQMIGRGMRLSPDTGKENCHLIDFVDNKSRHGKIVCVPTLHGLDPNEIIEEKSWDDLEKRADEMEAQRIKFEISEPRSVTYTNYDNPFDLTEDASGSPHLHRYSGHAWVAIGDIYILECMGKGYIKVIRCEKDDEKDKELLFQAEYFQPIEKVITKQTKPGAPPFARGPKFRRPRVILQADSLRAAIRGADSFASKKVCLGYQAQGLFRYAKWRSNPASEGQLKALEKMKKSQKDLDLKKLTRGQAANIITRIIHGAQGRYEKKQKEQAKQDAKKAKTETASVKTRFRQGVQVGPISMSEQDARASDKPPATEFEKLRDQAMKNSTKYKQ